MDKDEQDIMQALQNGGAFDSARAGEIRRQSQEQFGRSIRDITRHTKMVSLLTVAALAFCLAFIMNNNVEYFRVEAMCFLLILLFSGNMIRQWYWTMHTRVVILRELKEGLLALGGAKVDTPQPTPDPLATVRPRWLKLTIPVAVISALLGMHVALLLARPTHVIRTTTRITADGSVSGSGEHGFLNDNALPQSTLRFDTQIPTSVRTFWDSQGREIKADEELMENGPGRYVTLHLNEPMEPDRWFWYREAFTELPSQPSCLRKEDNNVWVMTLSNGSRVKKMVVEYTFQLPAGTEVLSPTPDGQKNTADGWLEIRYNREYTSTSSYIHPFELRYKLKNN